MSKVAAFPRGAARPSKPVGFRACGIVAGLAALWMCVAAAVPARASDPAVVYMAQVGRDLMAAARTRSPGVMANVINRHADVRVIGNYSLGEYRAKLSEAERPAYLAGMVRFISRYAATEAPKYPVARVEWSNQSMRGSSGVTVDSKVVLSDGTAYDVRWLLGKYGSTYKVRDAMVLGFWMTPFLKKLFEDYIAQNGGNPRALTAALNR
ncbi:MAG TPA: ABC transporter substrate-binding protein [Hyphomicrobiaceae bacterium]|nr:ABC transporter substrate-binding protein [Hyphomicrobiaceae bacterium]